MYCTGLFKLWEFYITGWSEINQNELINYDIGIYLGNLHQVIVDSLRNLFHFWSGVVQQLGVVGRMVKKQINIYLALWTKSFRKAAVFLLFFSEYNFERKLKKKTPTCFDFFNAGIFAALARKAKKANFSLFFTL